MYLKLRHINILSALVFLSLLYTHYWMQKTLNGWNKKHAYRWRYPYHRVEDLPLYIYSAAAQFNAQTVAYSEVDVITWDGVQEKDKLFKCCFCHTYGSLSSSKASVRRKIRTNITLLPYAVYSCKLPSTAPEELTLVLEHSECVYHAEYTKILYPKDNSGRFGICTKAAYGSLDSRLVVEWYEYQKMMGVDKVITLVFDNLNPKAKKVLEFYEKQGFAELVPFGLPGLPVRSFEEEFRKLPQFQKDERVTTLHCQDKLQRFSYAALIDWDEFIVPRQDITLKDMLQVLLEKWPMGAVFSLDVGFFIVEWNTTIQNNSLFMEHYTNRTKITKECHKNIYIPSRVKPHHVKTHRVGNVHGYTRHIVPQDIAILNHYRTCPTSNKWSDCLRRERFTDLNISKYQERIEDRIKGIFKILKI